jgi:hypothetical protein
MLTIAILALIGIVFNLLIAVGLFSEAKNDLIQPTSGLFLSAIAALSWWNICFPLSIVIITYGAVWAIIYFVEVFDEF